MLELPFKLVCVLGPPRSGTTLLQHLIDLHPRARVFRESHVLHNLPLAVSSPVGNHVLASFSEDKRVGWEAVTEAWSLHLLHHWEGYDQRDVARAMLLGLWLHLAGRPAVFGDKSPAYCRCWQQVVEFFPEAEFVWVERNEVATAKSLLRQSWFPAKDIDIALRHVRWHKEEAEGCPVSFWVRLESLEADWRNVVGGLLDHLGLPRDEYPWDKAAERFVPGARIN